MADKVNNITELPLDIIVLIFPYLDAKSFLAFCSTCKAFQQPSIRLDPAYWSYATRSTFRVPNQPVVQHDGDRWQKLFRRLLTQSRVYTWGNNQQHRLGHSYEPIPIPHNPAMPRMPRFRGFRHNVHVSSPTEMERTRDLGIIADMQCGGWSTTLLTSNGALYTAGILDGMRIMGAQGQLQALRFPVGYPYSTAAAFYDEPAINIRQFSAGRAHILGLSDSGRIWSWYDVQKSALQIKFVNPELKEASSGRHTDTDSSLFGSVKQVVAGWSRSSAYVHGHGIVVWDPVRRGPNDDEADVMLILENAEVPKTSFQRTKGSARGPDETKALGEEVGVVLNYIILEHFVVFLTDLGKVFCGRFGEKNRVEDILELRALRDNGTVMDVQGSFRRFAVFKNGEVIIAHQDYLEACWNTRGNNPEQSYIQGLKKLPALQHNDVISIAFGDYHFLALHSTGKITSYGTEVQSCGALGLGSEGDPRGHIRGVQYEAIPGHDGRLLHHAYTHGRQIWFEPEKREWIKHLMQYGKDNEEGRERFQMFASDTNVQGEFSEWIEQEGQEWDNDKGEDGLGAYFALRVSAAGWHSGALVLVNEELANKPHKYDWQNKAFPRLKLSDGREMPGEVEFDEWRQGRPEWQHDVEV